MEKYLKTETTPLEFEFPFSWYVFWVLNQRGNRAMEVVYSTGITKSRLGLYIIDRHLRNDNSSTVCRIRGLGP